jgi:hypothetical protein
MSATDSRYLTLSQVALRTGRHPELLRQWCAADRLPCLRLGGSWVMLERDLPLVDAIASRSGRARRADEPAAFGGTRVIAAVFDGADLAASAGEAVRRRLRLDATAIGTGPLSLPTMPEVTLTVVAARVASGQVVAARRVLAAYAGRIVADIEEVRAATPVTAEGSEAAGTGAPDPALAQGTIG